MLDDDQGWRADVARPHPGSATGPGRGSGQEFVAPVTVGRPQWQRRYTGAALAVHAAAIGSSPCLYILWHQVMLRPLLAVVLSVVALSLSGQCLLRGRLTHLRRQGRALSTMLAVGRADWVAALVEHTRHDPDLGWQVVGACTPTGAGPDGAGTVAGIPVVGDLDDVAAMALANKVDAVAVAPVPGWTAVRLQHLAWDLDHTCTALLVDAQLLPHTGPRARSRIVNGLPLLRVDHPDLGPGPRLVKRAMDCLGAVSALLLVAPILLLCTAAARRDRGPALHRRTCVGRGGREFTLVTFRTTAVGSGAPTRVGRLLDRYCLDELPQLFNVVAGSMALVGPRPSAPEEISGDRMARRRRPLLKPGVTGLGHLDGCHGTARVDDGAADPDLRYVTQWTPALDVEILVHTLRTSLRDRASN